MRHTQRLGSKSIHLLDNKEREELFNKTSMDIKALQKKTMNQSKVVQDAKIKISGKVHSRNISSDKVQSIKTTTKKHHQRDSSKAILEHYRIQVQQNENQFKPCQTTSNIKKTYPG